MNCRCARWCRAARRCVGRQRRQGVQRGRHREVADGVEVQLESFRAQPPHRLEQLLALDEQASRMIRGMTGAIQVRRGHRGGERLAHAVEHQLDRGRPEPPVGSLLAPGQQVVDLAEAAVPVPPQGRGHVAVQHPVVGRHQVRAERVRQSQLTRRAHARVLEARDAQRVQVRLARDEPGEEFGLGGRGRVRRDQAHRPVVQRPGRPAGLVPLDPPVDRVRGAGVDARDRHRRGVHPGAVVVPVRQEGGPPAGHGVQVGRCRQPAGKGRHGPPAAGHPGARRQRGAVFRHDLQALLPGPQPDQVAAQALQTAADRVHVRVAERGQRQPPAQIDHPGPAPGQLPYLVVAAHGGHDPVPDRQRRNEPGRVRRRPDLAARQHKVGLAPAHRPSLAHPPPENQLAARSREATVAA